LVLGVTKYFENTRCPIVYRLRMGCCEIHGGICFERNCADLERDWRVRDPFPTINFMFAVCGVLGGLVGSTIVTFGLLLICKEFRAFENWARVVMAGTVLGILLELSVKDDKLALHLGSLLPLFLGWQVTVAAIIGYCMVPRGGDGKPVR
jgi:hypothetical protein